MSDATTIDAGHLGPAGDDAAASRAYLVVREAGHTTVIDFDDGADILFGRSAEATVRLEDPKASREHARFVRRGAALRLEDLGSRNGTLLNEELVRGEGRPVRSGDRVRIGEAEIFVAETVGPTSEEPPPAASAAAGRPGPSSPSSPSASSSSSPPGVIVADPAMVRVFELVRRVAPAPSTVLILGETGVGKEVIAEQIHRQSPRAAKPLVRINCGSLPETLLESELFGHERGAFTGADKRKIGHVEAADGGTLFLDEVGELTAGMQTRLLRVLESRRFTRVGGREEIAADLRVVAATNRNLEVEIKTGRFREDLFFRLSAFVLRVPPLRERTAEVELLAELFARQFARRMNMAPPVIAPDAVALLRRHAWPGNVRELRNAMEHAVVLADHGVLAAEHLPETVRRGPEATGHGAAAAGGAPGVGAGGGGSGGMGAGVGGGPMREQLAEIERRSIQEALDAEHGNQTRAARRLGISRRALLYKLEKYGIKG